MAYLTYLALFLPLAGFFLLLAMGNRIGRRLTGIIACTSICISFLCFTTLLILYTNQGMPPLHLLLYHWIPVEQINADFSLTLDPLSILMTLIITGVGFLIHVYSIGYMDHEEDYSRYFACMNFFVFSMLLLVLAGNLLLVFVGWEGVGLASYLLIGFWHTRPKAAQAATKAFVVNRIGDLGFLIGLLLMFYLFGTGDISTISSRAENEFTAGAPVITLLTVLFFIGAIGKSAQLPLHVWLPDAMEGPTPVSALIHAATMVTAGVYLVVRLHAVFMLAPETLQLIGIIGAVTSLFAALCAVGQTDLKRVLAYSTVSQLGLMFIACGVGAFYPAMFHLTMHAFVKALLFLSAGNVVHMMHGTTDMKQMGGLLKTFKKTHWLFLIGVLSMSGVPPLAAFFSKDLILEEEYLAGLNVLFYVALAASVLTGFYLMRAYCLAFTGQPCQKDETIKEAPWVMLVPVSLLAFLSIAGGYLGCCKRPILESFLAKADISFAHESRGFILTPETWLSIAISLFGVCASAFIYGKYADRFDASFKMLRKSFYVDEIYQVLIVAPLKSFSRFIGGSCEPKFFDASLRAVSGITQKAATGLQHLQSGQIRSYVAWIVAGMVLLIVYLVF